MLTKKGEKAPKKLILVQASFAMWQLVNVKLHLDLAYGHESSKWRVAE